MKYIIFLIIYAIQIAITYPTFNDTCNPGLYALFLYLTHHLLDIYLFFSIFFLQTKLDFMLHALLVILIIIHWLTYDNKCILTVIMNRECGYPDEMWLDSIKKRLELRNISEYFHFIWLAALFAFDIYYI